MRRFSITTEIPAPAQRVWAVMRDVERWPEWTPTVTSIRLRDPGPLRVGSRALVRQPKLPPALWRVTELDEGRGFTWATRSPGVRVVARHRIEPLGDGSRATLSVEFEGLLAPLVARLTRRLNERYLALEVSGLRARCAAPAMSEAR
jgi:uncharacterized membrane protein